MGEERVTDNQLIYQQFRCPRCEGDLIREAIQSSKTSYFILCNSCKTIYVISDGIIDFRLDRKDYCFNQIPINQIEELKKKIQNNNWNRGVREFIKDIKNKKEVLESLINDRECAWKILLNLTTDTVLLDIGCGLGNITKNIAPHVKKTYALDLNYSCLEFAKKRFERFNANDDITSLAAGDGRYLPFPDNTLDCIVLSGISSWLSIIDTFSGERNPRKVERDFLREIKRILKPEGQIFIAVENRLNYERFSGLLEGHTGFKNGALLPRFLANLYAIAVRGHPYRTYVHSIGGYKKLLKEAGFRRIDTFALAPSYGDVQEIYPIEADLSNWRPEHVAPGHFANVKEKVKRNKYFVPAYGMVATASRGAQGSLRDRLFSNIERALAEQFGPVSIQIREYIITGKDKGVMLGYLGKQGIVIKLPFSTTGVVEEERNAAMLQLVKTRFARELSYCPRTLLHGCFQNMHYFVEERVKGTHLREVMRLQGRTACLSSIAEILRQLNPSSPETSKQPFIDDFYQQQVQQPLARLFRVIEARGLQEELASFFYENLYGRMVPCGIRHGDFGVANIFVQNGQISGLIDWEKSSANGIPIFDVFDYLNSVHRLFHSMPLPNIFPLLASGKWPIPEEKALLDQQCIQWGIDTSLSHTALVALYWLHTVIYRLDDRIILNEKRVISNIEGLIELVIT